MTNAGDMVPNATETTGTADGVSYKWTGLNFSTKPSWKQSENGAAFQLTESYTAPGLSNVTTINREMTVESVTVTQSIFQKIALVLLLSPAPVLANAVSQSNSGSITNQNYNVNNGNFHTNQYGGNIVCQGPMMNITPYTSFNANYSNPLNIFMKHPSMILQIM